MLRRRFVRDEQGAVLVEFGFVLPFFLILFCAMFDFALALLQVNALATAARDGARFGAVISDVATDDARVQNRTAAVARNALRTTRRTASSTFLVFLSSTLRSLVSSSIASATAALRIVIGQAIDCDAPTARNSNLLPVNANGEVRLRSPE